MKHLTSYVQSQFLFVQVLFHVFVLNVYVLQLIVQVEIYGVEILDEFLQTFPTKYIQITSKLFHRIKDREVYLIHLHAFIIK
jgi:hypothetical protein